MTTPTGTITMTDIQTEFGGSNPIGLNEYYAGGAYVPAGTAGVPSSGAISMNDLRGKSKAVPVTVTVTPLSTSEGNSFIIDFSAPSVLYNSIYWKLTSYTNLTDADFNQVSGMTYYETEGNAGYISQAFQAITDSLYEGPGTFRVTAYSDGAFTQQVGQSSLVTVTDTYSAGTITISRTSIYRYANLNTAYKSSLVTLPTSGLEGATIYYEVYTTTAGQTLSAVDVDAPTSLTGTLTVPSGGSIQLVVRATEWNPASPVLVEKLVVVRFRLTNASGTVLGTSDGITLHRTPSFSASVSPSTIREGQSTTVTVSMYYVPIEATSVFFTTSGTASLISDFIGYSSSSGEYQILDNVTSFQLTAALDTATEGDETILFTIRKSSTAGTAFWVIGDNPPSNPPITVQSPAQITSASANISSAQITSISSYPSSRTFTVQFRNTGGTLNNSNVDGSSQVTVDAGQVSSNAIGMLTDFGGNSATHSMQYVFTNPNYQTYTVSTSETFTWPVYQLLLSATGTNSNGSTRSIYAQITSTPTYATSRAFAIQYAIKAAGAPTWGAWTALSTVTVAAAATASPNTLIYGPVTASAQFDLKVRCVLSGQQIVESNTLTNLWLG